MNNLRKKVNSVQSSLRFHPVWVTLYICMKILQFIALLLVINLSPNLTKLKVCREHQHKNFMLTYVSHMRFIGLTWAINPRPLLL